VPLRDPRANLAHDLLDVDVLAVLSTARLGRLRGPRPAAFVAAPVLAATASMKVLPATVLWILICHRQYF
jgi:hypothetical protein